MGWKHHPIHAWGEWDAAPVRTSLSGMILEQIPHRLKRYQWERYLAAHEIMYLSLPMVLGYRLLIDNQGVMILGKRSKFRSYRLRQSITVLKDAVLEIGDHAFINDGVNICASKCVVIGDNVLIGDMTFIYDTDFHPAAPELPVRSAPVYIGRNVWIGTNSMILAGASIGDHSVIAAGSVVAGDIPGRTVAGGAPARVIREIDVPEGWVRP